MIDMNAQTRRQVMSILDDAHDLTIATKREDGYPQATVVGFVHDGEKIYFGCSTKSQKARNLASDDRMSATVTPPYKGWNDIRGLSIGGRARRVTDQTEAARVGELMFKRFPQIADFVKVSEDWDMALFRIDAEVISVLDYAKGFGHTELFKLPTPATVRLRA